MAKKSFKPQNLRTILAALLVVIFLGSAGLFYLSLNEFKSYAIDVSHRLKDAEASGQQIAQLQTLKGQLSESQQLVAKANGLFSTPEEFQTRALTDIRAIATSSGVAIAGTEFDEADNQNGENVMTVRLGSPVSYSKLISFFDGIESNLPKMQVTSATLAHAPSGNSDSVNVEEIKIKLTVR